MPDSFDPVEMQDNENITLFAVLPSLARKSNVVPNIIAGDFIGSLGIPLEIKSEEIEKSLDLCVKKLESLDNADDLFELIIACSQYKSKNYKSAFIKIEERIFGKDPSSMELQNNIISVNRSAQLSFHMLRAYRKAEDGDFESADKIWHQLSTDWLDADEKKKTHLLLHLYMINVCMNRWDDAFNWMKIFWATVKSTNPSERHEYAIWDNWVCCLLVTWFFSSHEKQFLQILKNKMGIFTTYYLNQKKMLLLKHLDNRFILELVSPQYYSKAREFYSSLPLIDIS